MIKIRLLGALEIKSNSGTLNMSESGSERLSLLLAYLLINRSRTVSKTELISVLWPSDNCSSPANALKNLIFRLRKLIFSAVKQKGLIRSDADGYGINTDLIDYIDTEEFSSLLKRGDADSIIKANDIYKGFITGDLVCDFYIEAVGIRYQKMLVEKSCEATTKLIADKNYLTAIEICTKSLNADYSCEKLHCLLLKAYYQSGSLDLANKHYKIARKYLVENIGIVSTLRLDETYRNIISTDIMKSPAKATRLLTEDIYTQEYDFFTFKAVYKYLKQRYPHKYPPFSLYLINISPNTGSEKFGFELFRRSYSKLKDIIRTSIRPDDIFCSVDDTSALILICGSERSEVIKKIDRDFKCFDRTNLCSIKVCNL